MGIPPRRRKLGTSWPPARTFSKNISLNGPRGRVRRIPADRRQTLRVSRCAGQCQGQSKPCPCNGGSDLDKLEVCSKIAWLLLFNPFPSLYRFGLSWGNPMWPVTGSAEIHQAGNERPFLFLAPPALTPVNAIICFLASEIQPRCARKVVLAVGIMAEPATPAASLGDGFLHSPS